jgi:hypothetical protein
MGSSRRALTDMTAHHLAGADRLTVVVGVTKAAR